MIKIEIFDDNSTLLKFKSFRDRYKHCHMLKNNLAVHLRSIEWRLLSFLSIWLISEEFSLNYIVLFDLFSFGFNFVGHFSVIKCNYMITIVLFIDWKELNDRPSLYLLSSSKLSNHIPCIRYSNKSNIIWLYQDNFYMT